MDRKSSCLSLAALCLLAPFSFAQEDPLKLDPVNPQAESRQSGSGDDYLSTFQDPSTMPGFLGQSRAGFTTRFDNTFNPAIGVVLDALGEFSSASQNAGRFNKVRMRTLELDIASRIDPLGWAYAVAAFVDTGTETEVELEEAAAWLDQLPNNFSVRAGRYLADFGKWNTLHTHDKAFVNEDVVRREVFGGPLFTTGAELHHWFGVGDVPVRWSIGLASDAEGDDHDAFGDGHGHAHGSEFLRGRRGIDNWAATARLSAQYDVGDNGYFQWGLSGFYTPGAIQFEEEIAPSGRELEIRRETRKSVVAADLTFRSVNSVGGTAHTASMEYWHDQSQFGEPLVSDGHHGLWGFYEYAFSPYWGAGVVASWANHGDSVGQDFLAGGDSLAQRGVFLSWWLSEFNRLRLQVQQVNPGFGEDKYWTVALQWSVILGVHAHSLDW
ncbi:MAG: hypothetical protein DWQ01_02960 [Planctomycetota bacterium]|nr:MAG: hypothetical protein DWQ01_02960 [Planctomycetota bacterium]